MTSIVGMLLASSRGDIGVGFEFRMGINDNQSYFNGKIIQKTNSALAHEAKQSARKAQMSKTTLAERKPTARGG